MKMASEPPVFNSNEMEKNVDKEMLRVAKEIEELTELKETLKANISSDADFISTLDLMTKLRDYVKNKK